MLDNRSRIYALESWTVEKKRRGWFIKRTHSADQWRGPYRTEMSACLTIARHLHREIVRRDAPPPELPFPNHFQSVTSRSTRDVPSGHLLLRAYGLRQI